jgi:hypothetical protein
VNPYGECYHTKYEGSSPCIHDVWNEGRDAGFTEGMKWRMGSDAAWQYWFKVGLDAARQVVWEAECDCTRGPGEEHSASCLTAPMLAAIDALRGAE